MSHWCIFLYRTGLWFDTVLLGVSKEVGLEGNAKETK
jgi:hypothetical protein